MQADLLDQFSLVADPFARAEKLAWEPETSLDEIARMMVDADLARLEESSPSAAASVGGPALAEAEGGRSGD